MIRPEIHNVFWAGLEAAVSGGLSFASAFLIARLIGPNEFGIAAAAIAMHVLLWVVATSLFADALVQRDSLDDVTTASAFWTALAIGVGCALLQAGAGKVLAAAFADARLEPICLLLALPLPVVSAAGVAQGLLTRRRAYRVLAGRAILGQGLGTITGIAAALQQAGAWAPVLQQTVTATVGALTLLLGVGWRPRAVFRGKAVRSLLGVALPLTASTLVLHARYRLFALLLGGTAGATALGETHMAFRLVDTVRELCATAQWRLMLPILAEHQHDEAALRLAVDRLTRRSNAMMLPLCGAMVLAWPPLAVRLLGPAWITAGGAAIPLIGLMALLCLMFPAGVAVVARGQAKRALLGTVVCLLLTVAGVMLLHPITAWQAVLVWCGAQAAVVPYGLWMNGRAVGAGPLRPLRGALTPAALTASGLVVAACMPTDGSLLRVVIRLAAFAAVVLAGSARRTHALVTSA